MFFLPQANYAATTPTYISIVNYNVSGTLQNFEFKKAGGKPLIVHDTNAFNDIFTKFNTGQGLTSLSAPGTRFIGLPSDPNFSKNLTPLDFVSTVEMVESNYNTNLNSMDAVRSNFQNALNTTNPTGTYSYIGRIRGGNTDRSPQEMVALFYNTKRWTLTTYANISVNPVLKNNCNEYKNANLLPSPNSTYPCALAQKDPALKDYQYTFQINYVEGSNNYFIGDRKQDVVNKSIYYGPWNRIATFGVFTLNGNPAVKIIVVSTHFPRGKGNEEPLTAPINKQYAFDAVYNYVITKLRGNTTYPVIFIGDLNYKPYRDNYRNFFDTDVRTKTIFANSQFCGLGKSLEQEDVLWTINSTNLVPVSCVYIPLPNANSTTDHIVTRAVYKYN